MIKKKDNLRIVPKKNYIIAILILLITIAIIIYVSKATKINREKKYSESTLSSYIIGELKYDEIDNVFTEVSSDYFVYISYLSDSEVYNFEKKLKNIITDYSLQDQLYYLNVTDKMESADLMNELNRKFKLEYNKIKKLPAILYYKEGKLENILTSNNNLLSLNEFKLLLDNNNYIRK